MFYEYLAKLCYDFLREVTIQHQKYLEDLLSKQLV